MKITDKINNDLKKALIEKDKNKVLVLKGLKSAILNAEIASGKRETGLDEAELTAILQKEVKSRKESADIYKKGGEQQRADKELSEVVVIEEYLPKQMSDEELEQIVDSVMVEMGEVSPQQMGQVIGAVKQQAGASADGARIASLVKDKLVK